ncbi:MAG: glycosyltransferase family 39 protein [Chloroflexi bacterium]|nr:glycosyltransferase family 39 protein [Chloroflexota bacterium]
MLQYPRRSKAERSTHNRRLALVLSLYLALAVLYSIVVPIGQGADEWAHYWYAQFIAEHGRLPANPAEREAAGYKSDWPPLYHLLAAAVTGWIETDGPPTFKYLPATPFGAGHIRRQLVSMPLTDAILHTDDERFPWQQEILVWHLGRFLSITFSLGTLLVTYRIALEVFTSSRGAGEQGSRGAALRHAQEPEQGSRGAGENGSRFTSPQTLALVCTVFLAFIPRFLFTGMLFNYDSLTLLLASLFFWLALRITSGYFSRWGFLALGGLAGLALMSKYLAALLPLEIILLALIKGGDRQESSISPLPLRSPVPLLKLGQAALAFLLVTGGWFGYLLLNFNEIETYGPVLGVVAPLLRGDGSDRTVEQLFAWLSSGQAPSPAHIERTSYTSWQIIAGFFTSFWGNAIRQPYSLNWFVWLMTIIAIVAVVGLVIAWRTAPTALPPRRLTLLLLLHSFLPLPFMVIRLFGTRDALEAVQGRHLLFLSGPAIVILLVWSLSRLTPHALRFTPYALRLTPYALRFTPHASRFTFYALIGLTLSGAISQLIYMGQVYLPLLPVRTTPYAEEHVTAPPVSISLDGRATLIGQSVTPVNSTGWPFNLLASSSPAALKVDLIWQAGPEPALEDYLLELALVDGQGQTQASWLAYQTQAHYPTRAWEAGDTIRDEGWLPLLGLPAGDYELRWRVLGEAGEILPWQTLSTYTLSAQTPPIPLTATGWVLWRKGQIAARPPPLRERETAQFTFADRRPPTADRRLAGPDGISHPPASAGEGWANFIVGPDWPPGDYRLQPEDAVVLRVAPNGRNFQPPAMTHPLEVNFENKIKLLGYDLPTRRVQPGEGLPLTLYWQGLNWMGEEFVIFERLLDNQGMAWGGYDRLAQENYSTLLWAPGEIVTDSFAVPVAAEAPPGIYTLNLGWYRQVNGEARSLPILSLETGQPSAATSITIDTVKVGGPPPNVTVLQAAAETQVNITLGEEIKLLGFDLASQQVGEATEGGSPTKHLAANGEPRFTSSPLHLTLYWQALTSPAKDYTVFAHIRNAGGKIVAQQDNPPAHGAYPTGLWDAGEIIKDEMSVSLEQLEPGRYELVVGMYDFATGERLLVTDSPDNAILLQSFEVSE